MAITSAMTNRFKQDILDGVHLPGHTYKVLLIKVGHAGTYDKNTTAVGTPGTGAPSTSNVGTDEAAGTGYTSGGATLSGRTIALTADVASLDFADGTWATATISAVGAVVYNDTVAGKPALGVFDFGGTITSTAALFTAQIPTAGVGLLRVG